MFQHVLPYSDEHFVFGEASLLSPRSINISALGPIHRKPNKMHLTSSGAAVLVSKTSFTRRVLSRTQKEGGAHGTCILFLGLLHGRVSFCCRALVLFLRLGLTEERKPQ